MVSLLHDRLSMPVRFVNYCRTGVSLRCRSMFAHSLNKMKPILTYGLSP
jgi:hypothetical protein